MDNVLYTLCADNKIRVYTTTDYHALSALQPWTEIDMDASVQPRHAADADQGSQRYGFVLDSRDFCGVTEQAVLRTKNKGSHGLEHIIEVANKSPEICVVINRQGNMSAWALEDVGCKGKAELSTFNILHVEGLNFSFMPNLSFGEDYAQIWAFQSAISSDLISILVHHFDGRIEWFDSPVDILFDPAPHKDRVALKATWSGHSKPIKKLVRNAIGDTLASRTNDNKALIWRQTYRDGKSVLVRKSSLFSEEHIHRTCVIGNGDYLVNLHHDRVSLWDIRTLHAKRLAVATFRLSSKPLCVLQIPTTEPGRNVAYVAAIGADLKGIAWEILLPTTGDEIHTNGHTPSSSLHEFCTFDLGVKEDISYVLPVDPAGPRIKVSEFFDVFATDIALTYTHSGIVRTWAAKIDKENSRVNWLLTSTVETGIVNPSLASGSSIRKAALVDENHTRLTIWDTSNAQLDFEETFSEQDVIRDLDWTSTPDMQSILAVGFPQRVILLSQLRYDYLDSRPSWTQIQEVRISDLTPHPIGDSCWLNNGHLVVGAGNQLFVHDKKIGTDNRLVSELRIPSYGMPTVDLFEVVSRLNGPLPAFHPQFLAQCILSGKTNLVHSILMTLHRKLKFYTEGDDLDGFLGIPLEDFYVNQDVSVLCLCCGSCYKRRKLILCLHHRLYRKQEGLSRNCSRHTPTSPLMRSHIS